MKVDELREKYLAFFESKGHTRCPSDVLVPTWDPSVLFTPAGMNQFKDHFMGKVKLDFTKATTCQKCLRTGDIDNVGRTAYHHTFFEMMGNFSFGDYFKRDAIHWAWEFLTAKEWLGIEPARLSITVYMDDDEAADIWSSDIKVPVERIERMGEGDNFWPASAPSQGPDGVCGPCSEIFYHPDDGNEVEIWNLVFTQFNRVGNPPDNLRPLPSKNIDTGMGLERTAAVLQGVETNYHIDNLMPIVQAAAEICGTKYDAHSDDGRRLRRITDHVRACTFCIHENVYPGPNKEKYVVKRLLRRAVLDGRQMNLHEPFLHQLVPAVVEAMHSAYPELAETQERVSSVIKKEEASFFSTIDAGLERIERTFEGMESRGSVLVEGAEAAELYQTYGVPPELFESMAAERNLTFDWEGFQNAMQAHGEASGKQEWVVFKAGAAESLKRAIHYTEFLGYESTEAEAEVKGIIAQDQLCDKVSEVGHEKPIVLVLNRTPFYGESGGQVGDTGEIVGEGFKFQVIDTQKDSDLILHHGHLTEGEIHAGAKVSARVDTQRRGAIGRAHSATHIMHHALQQTLGSHAQQQGSKVDDDWLRFDFTNLSPVTGEQLMTIEKDVNQRVAAAETIQWQTLPLADAREAGAMMLFGEKYPDPVRMVSMGEFSKELCGGTHLSNTQEVAAFDIISEEGVSAGTRRITALTGEKAREHIEQIQRVFAEVAALLKVPTGEVPAAVKALSQSVRDLKKQIAGGGKSGTEKTTVKDGCESESASLDYARVKEALRESARTLNIGPFDVADRVQGLLKEIEDLKKQLAERDSAGQLSAETLLADAQDTAGAKVAGTKVIVAEVPAANPNLMRQLIDQIRQQASPVAVLLATRLGDDKVAIVAGFSRDLVDAGAHAGKWIGDVAQVVGGRGGGKPDMAQAGGKEPDKLPEALEVGRRVVTEMVAN